MTHKPGKTFSLISLDKITPSLSTTASGVTTTFTPFIPFREDFIQPAKGPKTTTLGSLKQGKPGAIDIFRDGNDDIPAGLYKEIDAVGFFDSLHDFKLDFLDSEGYVYNKQYSYVKFMFSFLLRGGYPALMNLTELLKPRIIQNPQTLIQDKYSYLKSFPRPLNTEELENYFSIGNIYQTITNKDPITNKNLDGDIWILPNTRKHTFLNVQPWHIAIYNKLLEFFGDYVDENFNNTIKLMFDFQMNLFDIIKNIQGGAKTPKLFSILYTAETITDSASKSKAVTINEVFGYENWYIEHLPVEGRGRGYAHNDDTIKGNVGVTYSSIQYSDPTSLDDSDFTVNLIYNYDGTPESPENITMNKQQTTKEYVTSAVNNFMDRFIKRGSYFFTKPSNTADSNNLLNKIIKLTKSDKNQRAPIYTLFNEQILNSKSDDKTDLLKDFSLKYARKRLGDTLQGRVCKLDILGNLRFRKVEQWQRKTKTLPAKPTGKIMYKIAGYNTDSDPPRDETQTLIQPRTSAVLVTHDRMLFSYAVINKIPVILDLEHNMIIYRPTNSERPTESNNVVGGNNSQSLYLKNQITEQTYISSPSIIQTGGLTLNNPIKMATSIISNIDEFIRYLFIHKNKKLHIIRGFLKYINNKLDNNELQLEYIGKYKYNILIIGDATFIQSKITEIEEKEKDILNELYNSDNIEGPETRSKARERLNIMSGNELITIPSWIMIKDGDNHLYVTRQGTGFDSILDIDLKYNEKIFDKSKYGFSFKDISKKLAIGSQANIYSPLGVVENNPAKNFVGDVLRMTKEIFPENLDIKKLESAEEHFDKERAAASEGKNEARAAASEGKNEARKQIPKVEQEAFDKHLSVQLSEYLNNIYVELPNWSEETEVLKRIVSHVDDFDGGGKNNCLGMAGGKTDKMPLYEIILDTNFNLLNNRDNLLHNNITVITFLFQLLRDYEVSFINYQEGIESFYTKINESSVGYMIDVNNWIPHNIEFYIFLKLILRDYDQDKLSKINYSLFEYYLYKYKNENNIYFRFQTIKSYLLDINYEVIITPEIEADLMSEINLETKEYFEKIMKEACTNSETVIIENYNATQQEEPNYNIVYANVEKYSLKLCGFSDMKDEYIDKTYEIIGKMIKEKSPLIQRYIQKVEDTKSFQEEISVKPEVSSIDIVKPTIDKAKGIKTGEKITVLSPTGEKIAQFHEDQLRLPKKTGFPKINQSVNRLSPYEIQMLSPMGQSSMLYKDNAIAAASGGKKNKLTKRKNCKEKRNTRKYVKKINKTMKNRKVTKRHYTKKRVI
jgi:hypothetical protein